MIQNLQGSRNTLFLSFVKKKSMSSLVCLILQVKTANITENHAAFSIEIVNRNNVSTFKINTDIIH